MVSLPIYGTFAQYRFVLREVFIKTTLDCNSLITYNDSMMIFILSLWCNIANASDYSDVYSDVETRLGLPAGMLKAMGEVESNHKNVVTHRDGVGEHTAYGLLQIHEDAMKQVRPKAKVDNLLNPSFNVQVGGEYLIYQYKRCGTWIKALGAYNSGKCKPFSKYAAKVLKVWND